MNVNFRGMGIRQFKGLDLARCLKVSQLEAFDGSQSCRCVGPSIGEKVERKRCQRCYKVEKVFR